MSHSFKVYIYLEFFSVNIFNWKQSKFNSIFRQWHKITVSKSHHVHNKSKEQFIFYKPRVYTYSFKVYSPSSKNQFNIGCQVSLILNFMYKFFPNAAIKWKEIFYFMPL